MGKYARCVLRRAAARRSRRLPFVVATVVLTVITGLLFLSASLLKLTNQPQAREGQEKFGLSAAAYQGIGVLELLGVIGVVVGLFVPLLGVAAGAGLAAVAIGALLFHVRAKDALPMTMSAVMALAVTVGYIVARLASR